MRFLDTYPELRHIADMDGAQKKVGFRDSFRDFAAADTGKDLGNLTSVEIGYELIKFYVFQIHNRISNYISEDDFDYSVTDGKDDLGVDLIFKDDGMVVILQSKYFRQGKGPTLKDIQHFQSIFHRLRDPNFTKNSRLADRVAEIDFDKDTFALKFVCLGKIEGQASEQKQRSLDLPQDLSTVAERCTIDFLDELTLTEELRNALTQDAGIPDTLEIVTAGPRGKRSGILEINSGGFPSYVMVVEGSQIAHLYQNAKDRLFTFNIRNYIGNTATNKQIIRTAKEKPEHFFHFNNGIAALAKTVVVDPGRDRIMTTGLQIINGAQTVKAIARAGSGGNLPPDLQVLLRVTEIQRGYGAEGEFTQRITRFNNTQNVIKVSDFRSNDPIQNDLKEKFDYHRRGKKVEYLPKRTDKRKSSSIAIRLEDFTKVIYSFLGDPVSFSGSTSFLFDEEGGYRIVFGDGTQIWNTMPLDQFRLRSAIWWLCDEFTQSLKEYKSEVQDQFAKAALERKWVLFFVARLVLERTKGESEYKKMLALHWKGDWEIGVDETGKMFKNLFDICVSSVVYRYKEAMKQSGFVHRNWMRSKTTVSDLRDYIMSNPLLRL
jgi:hypothetical protein